ncbi:P-loop containing nucleoside triphosphate hydrolase protein [Macrophomina phaseolina]|uniref:P-loop containing nucleoside triphosphate hydrolase protein n=1 Tax=Macrophomina phaseolina TaxID=35725 RepID=A0ABQ8GMF8_9PEZI|nr:P-loop containing nucleoside triphosphate hydrolase protein [Macrophomina phaseolina]
MGQQANQGLPRQPGEASPPSIRLNRPTPEAKDTASTAAVATDSLELPILASPKIPVNEALASVSSKRFNIGTVCAALQNKCSIKALAEYLGTYVPDHIKIKMNDKIVGRASPIFYAIEYAINNDSLQSVELLIEYRADPNALLTTKHFCCQIPTLAFTIICAAKKLKDSLPILKLLLSAGAKPELTLTALNNNVGATAQWSAICNNAINVSHVYLLERAQRGSAVLQGLKKQLAGVYELFALLTIDHYLIGQDYAIKLVKETLFSHVVTNSQYPLVMAFAGPSGHGKTEMASQMGTLLSLEITIVDCTHMKHDTDLFGSLNGYKRSDEGSQLNNFLKKHDGKRAIVFLEEFDKTTRDVHHSLLLICDSSAHGLKMVGIYCDRRDNKSIDCSKIIWVLATNLGHQNIKNIYKEKLSEDSAKPKTNMSMELLHQELLEIFTDHFGPPFTGRVDVIVPFLPFTEVEQCALTHSLLMRLADESRLPIDCHPTVKRYIGHSHLEFGDGIELSQHIARSCYNPELGARSLKRGIEELKRKFVMAYCDAHPDEVTEDLNTKPVRSFRAQVRRTMDGKTDMVVIYQGISKIGVEKATAAAIEDSESNECDSDTHSPRP